MYPACVRGMLHACCVRMYAAACMMYASVRVRVCCACMPHAYTHFAVCCVLYVGFVAWPAMHGLPRQYTCLYTCLLCYANVFLHMFSWNAGWCILADFSFCFILSMGRLVVYLVPVRVKESHGLLREALRCIRMCSECEWACMCADMCVDMCINMCMDVCADIRLEK